MGWGTNYSREQERIQRDDQRAGCWAGPGEKKCALDSVCGGGKGERWTDLREFTENTEQTNRLDKESQ